MPLKFMERSIDKFKRCNWGNVIAQKGKENVFQGCLPLLEARTKLISNKCSTNKSAKIYNLFLSIYFEFFNRPWHIEG